LLVCSQFDGQFDRVDDQIGHQTEKLLSVRGTKMPMVINNESYVHQMNFELKVFNI